MEDQQTCGRGLAENSGLPAKPAELTEAVAEILEAHMEAFDRTDEESRAENDSYRDLAKEHRKLSALLQTRMESDRKMLQAMSGAG